MDTQKIVLGGGCFWCTEAIFQSLQGVISVTPGYTGGHTENPTYEDVSTGETGHVEAVQIIYDPQEISMRELLTVFFATHDPTTRNRQGNDIGTQYRSAIFYTTTSQQKEVDKFIETLNKEERDPIVTEVAPLEVFYEAEDYHKDYYTKNKEAGYCQLVINPKLEKVQEEFKHLLASQYE